MAGLVLEGENEISKAWEARGGYANTVSDSSWKGFNEHLAMARNISPKHGNSGRLPLHRVR